MLCLDNFLCSVCAHACISVCLSMNDMFEYEHACLKCKIVHGDADAHWSLCVSPRFYQLPPDPQIQRPQQGFKHRISTDIIWKRSLFSFPLSLMFSHSHPSLSLSLHLISLSSLYFFFPPLSITLLICLTNCTFSTCKTALWFHKCKCNCSNTWYLHGTSGYNHGMCPKKLVHDIIALLSLCACWGIVF